MKIFTLQILWKTYVLVIMLVINPAYAEVVFDGTLGPPGLLPLQDNVFFIGDHLGKQMGNNLFHSFEKFNLSSQETALFYGPDSIENVISRITGGEPSFIDGRLVSQIGNANMYFLNPAGIMFGPNAILDVPASFHASTADYLRFGDGGRFDATYSEQPLLTVAPPSAFGFLSDSQASIYSQALSLSLPTIGKTLSLIGGDIVLENAQFAIENQAFYLNHQIKVTGGKVNLVSVGSSGEMPINPENMPKNAFERFGRIKINDKFPFNHSPNIDVSGISGTGGGEIEIIGGKIVLENSYMFADTYGNQDGKGITIKAEDLRLTQASRITAQVVGIPSFENSGNGGNINITAERITIADGSQIDITTLANTNGNAGEIKITATESLNVSGCLSADCSISIYSGIQSSTTGTGKGGQITVSTPTLTMDNHATIRSETQNLGDAGDISINVDTLALTGGAQINLSAAFQSFNQSKTGNAGQLIVSANKGVYISGYGYEGQRSGLFSNTLTNGKGGMIEILAPTGTLQLQDDGTIQSGASSLGDAGNIFLTVANMVLDNVAITTESAESAGGDISIQLSGNLQLMKGQITTKALGDEKRDSGGNITINQPDFLILDKSQLTTTGFVGDGGHIRIVAESFIQSNDSILDASSTLGVDGEIFIDASIEDFLELNLLSSQFGQSQLQILPCATRLPKEMSTFTLGARRGLFASPDDLQR